MTRKKTENDAEIICQLAYRSDRDGELHLLKRLLPTISSAMLACAPALAADISCRVVGVTDGDTLTCLTSEKQQINVRLAQIDAPEKDQPFGQRSKKALSDLAFGRQVTIEPETTDKYGRTVAKVVSGGEDLNLAMVRSGMAWVYDKYARDREYFDAQESARSSRTGLWDDPNAVRPSDWRHGDRRIVRASTSEGARNSASAGAFACAGKRFCTQMASCEEARHYLTACGMTKLDRDGDGIPCEALCQLSQQP